MRRVPALGPHRGRPGDHARGAPGRAGAGRRRRGAPSRRRRARCSRPSRSRSRPRRRPGRRPSRRTPAARPAAAAGPRSAREPGNGAGDPLAARARPAARAPAAAAGAAPRPPPPQPAVAAAPVTPAAAAPRPRSPPSPTRRRSRCACPEGEQVDLGETLAVGVEPGGRARVLALVRNQSGIVDNYELSVRGLPNDWWSIFPNTVYLVPFGTSGTYEQEVEIHLHPPRSRRGRGADLGARGRRRVEGLQQAGRGRAAAPRHPAVRGVQDQALARARVRPQEGAVRRRGQEHRQRARSPSRSTPPTPTTSSTYKFTPRDDGDPAGPVGHVEDAGQAAAPALDRAPGGEAHPGLHQDRRGGRPGQDRRGHGAARGLEERGRGRGRRGRAESARACCKRLRDHRARAPRSAPSGVRVQRPARGQAARSRARTST